MAFDMGWGFRNTAAFVTDPAYQCPGLPEDSYPKTYTNSNGISVNAGWTTTVWQSENISASNDARIAGDNYSAGNQSRTFRVDLSSGSAPGTGDYSVDIASGNNYKSAFTLYDDATALITGSAANKGNTHYEDATGADVVATTSWTGATATKTFASTTANLILTAVNYAAISHFRLTKQEAGGTNTDITPPSALRLG